MPLPVWAPFAISAGTQALGGLFGNKKQTTSYEMSPEARQLYLMYKEQLGRGTPGYLTDPINRVFGARAKQTQESMGEALGPGSGLEMAQLKGLTAEKGRTLGNVGQQHQEMLMRQLAALVAPPSQTTKQPQDWGQTIGDIGGDFLEDRGFQDYMKRFGKQNQGNAYQSAFQLGSKIKSGPGAWGVQDIKELFDLLQGGG